MKHGIDVSYAQGQIDWDAVKKSVDFAIIRCGYGDDIASQDDNWWLRNVSEAERVGIPYGVYLYSYIDSEAHLQSEIAHTLRLINGHRPFCVYLDLEGNIFRQGKASLTGYAKRWCKAITDAGYKAGVYASGSWWDNHVDIYTIYNAGYSVWVAQYGPQPHWDGVNYDLWQFTSDGTVKGINTRVDLNRLYNDALIERINIKGFLDGADLHGCRGWCWNDLNNAAVNVHIYAFRDGSNDGTFLCAIDANEYREDLAKAGIGNGYHAFETAYNLKALGEGIYTVRAYGVIGDNNKQLNGEMYVTVTADDLPKPEPEPTSEPEPTPEPEPTTPEPDEPTETPAKDDTSGKRILDTLKKLIRLIIKWAFGGKDNDNKMD